MSRKLDTSSAFQELPDLQHQRPRRCRSREQRARSSHVCLAVPGIVLNQRSSAMNRLLLGTQRVTTSSILLLHLQALWVQMMKQAVDSLRRTVFENRERLATLSSVCGKIQSMIPTSVYPALWTWRQKPCFFPVCTRCCNKSNSFLHQFCILLTFECPNFSSLRRPATSQHHQAPWHLYR